MRRWTEERTAEDAATTFFIGVFRRQRRRLISLIDLIGAFFFVFETIVGILIQILNFRE
jgi:hypothetical protein